MLIAHSSQSASTSKIGIGEQRIEFLLRDEINGAIRFRRSLSRRSDCSNCGGREIDLHARRLALHRIFDSIRDHSRFSDRLPSVHAVAREKRAIGVCQREQNRAAFPCVVDDEIEQCDRSVVFLKRSQDRRRSPEVGDAMTAVERCERANAPLPGEVVFTHTVERMRSDLIGGRRVPSLTERRERGRRRSRFANCHSPIAGDVRGECELPLDVRGERAMTLPIDLREQARQNIVDFGRAVLIECGLGRVIPRHGNHRRAAAFEQFRCAQERLF